MRPREADLIKRKVKCSIKKKQSGFCSCVDLAVQVVLSTELKERRRRRQRERQKAIGLDWQNNNFARASHFFVHF